MIDGSGKLFPIKIVNGQLLFRQPLCNIVMAQMDNIDAKSHCTNIVEEKQQRIIRKFFADYKEELSKHFAYEEGQVFPYVEAVLNKQNSAPFTIGEYEENHSNVEEKLEDLKNLVMKYIPAPCNQQDAYKVLFYIYTLEYDLGKHTFIEDDILVPMVGRMENHE